MRELEITIRIPDGKACSSCNALRRGAIDDFCCIYGRKLDGRSYKKYNKGQLLPEQKRAAYKCDECLKCSPTIFDKN